MPRKNETTANDSLLTGLVSELSFSCRHPLKGGAATTKRQFGKARSKYGSKRTTRIDGETFDSHGELRWLTGLERLAERGLISDLRRQVTFDLTFNGRPVRSLKSGRVLRCRPDAVFTQDGRTVIADYKGAPMTAESLLKFSLLAHMMPEAEIRLEGPGAPKPRRTAKRTAKGRAR